MRVNAVSTQQTPLGRWIIVLPAAKDWAWSGSRWVNHRGGISLEAQVCNFATEIEALEHARKHCLIRQELCNKMHRRGPEKWYCVLDKGHTGECSPFVGSAQEEPTQEEPPKHKPRRPELTPMRHAICDACWQKREPGQEPIRLKDAEPVDCCFCNRRTHSRIFLKADSAHVPCGGRH